MHRHRPAGPPVDVISTPFRRPLLGFIVCFLFAAAPTVATAVSTAPLVTEPATKALHPLTDVDLTEAAFREGVQLYHAGQYSAAARTWEAPAARGHAGAQFSLGVAYATGNGVSQSLSEAIRWWQAAATGGHVSAQLNLGLLYWRGEGVEKDLAKARLWWHRAADGGDAAAQFHLGAMAAIGEGEPLNYKEAARWWRRSAAQGYDQAIKGLEILKSSGVAVDESN